MGIKTVINCAMMTVGLAGAVAGYSNSSRAEERPNQIFKAVPKARQALELRARIENRDLAEYWQPDYQGAVEDYEELIRNSDVKKGLDEIDEARNSSTKGVLLGLGGSLLLCLGVHSSFLEGEKRDFDHDSLFRNYK